MQQSRFWPCIRGDRDRVVVDHRQPSSRSRMKLPQLRLERRRRCRGCRRGAASPAAGVAALRTTRRRRPRPPGPSSAPSRGRGRRWKRGDGAGCTSRLRRRGTTSGGASSRSRPLAEGDAHACAAGALPSTPSWKTRTTTAAQKPVQRRCAGARGVRHRRDRLERRLRRVARARARRIGRRRAALVLVARGLRGRPAPRRALRGWRRRGLAWAAMSGSTTRWRPAASRPPTSTW